MLGEFASLKLREQDLAEDYTKVKELIDAADLKPDTILSAPPAVNGEVVRVMDSLALLSVGRDDGVRIGHTLDVSRGTTYVGRLKVQRVDDNYSVAEMLDSYRRSTLRTGDRVDSKLLKSNVN